MKKAEILAPVGGREQLEAAVRSKADAVYFGASSFNARRNAENFDDTQFMQAVKYCRERGVKTYITLNTIYKDSESREFSNTLKLIAQSGADAVILQDLGAVKTVKECCPTLHMHASTQMAVHNVAGAKFLEEMGFSRIVLARELSVREISEICSQVNTEIEVFVHGAHCMSASGMCYMSSILGGRSGNRGLCAQPCRLNFKTGKREYALSLKDMCLANMTEELVNAGVTSFKIEGRMKRPEYTASAVKVYKDALEGNTPDVDLLKSVFSRSGFTCGYAVGKRDLSMFGYRTKEDVVSASSVLSEIASSYRKEAASVPVTMKLFVKENEESRLVLSDGKNVCEVTGKVPETARTVALNEESAKRSLLKLGSTFYYCTDIFCDIGENLSLGAADLNLLRREACERLTYIRGLCDEKPFSDKKEIPFIARKTDRPELRLMFRCSDMIPKGISADKLIVPLADIVKDKSLIDTYKDRLVARIDALIYPQSEKKVLENLNFVRERGVKYAYCDNIGAVALALTAKLKVLGGTLLNVLNSDAAEMYYALGVEDITLSAEISFKDAEKISSKGKIGLTVYGRLPLMHFRCCPLQSEKGCSSCDGVGTVTDRYNTDFPVLCEKKAYSVLYNSVPLYVGDKNLPKTDFITLSFVNETPEEIIKICDAAKNKKALSGKKTAGLYGRELL